MGMCRGNRELGKLLIGALLPLTVVLLLTGGAVLSVLCRPASVLTVLKWIGVLTVGTLGIGSVASLSFLVLLSIHSRARCAA